MKRGCKDESKLKIVLTRTDGSKRVHTFSPRTHKNFTKDMINWSSPVWVKKINAFRQQTFRRAIGLARPTRFRWTRVEERALQKAVTKEISRSRSKDNMDWNNVQRDYNRSLAGKIRKQGLKYAETMDFTKTTSATAKSGNIKSARKPMKDRVIETSGPFETRTVAALQNQAKKFASLQAILSRVIPADWELNEDELNESSSESENETDDEEDGSESDAGLEEDSDDEIDGKRPAGNANEGTLVSAV